VVDLIVNYYLLTNSIAYDRIVCSYSWGTRREREGRALTLSGLGGHMQTRRYVQIAATFTAVAAIAACNPFANKQKVGQIDPQNASANTQWNATLSTPGGMTGAVDLHGTASLAASGQKKSLATVSITNAAPKGAHPWHVYEGQCGDDGAVVGSASSYPLLNVANDGHATASATLPLELPTSGSYYVVVNASAANMQTVLACGNLAPPNAQ